MSERPATAPSQPALVAIFTLTLVTSAGLLFWLQPMAAKFILPSVGGVPQVWNTAMLFFQTALLAGYLYAHLLSRRVAPKGQVVMHVGLLCVALAWLPIGLDLATPPSDGDPSAWVLSVLASGIGVPFVVVAGSAPLLQTWFAATRHKDAHNPYFLYAASNIGSMAALFGYPLVAEPLLDLTGQSQAWSAVFALLIFLTVLSAWMAHKDGALTHTHHAVQDDARAPSRSSWIERGLWLALVLCSTSLMLGVTTTITTDVASVPLLWVAPLALFLATFIVAFARKPWVGADGAFRLMGAVLLILAILFFAGAFDAQPVRLMAALMAVFLVVAFACHSELAAIRPPKQRLTEFYLWIAVGGALGGAFNALVVPQVFQGAIEFYLVLFVALALILAARRLAQGANPVPMVVLAGLCAVVVFAGDHSGAFVADGVVERERNYFGQLTVRERPDLGVRVMVYGTTNHGIQNLTPGQETTPGSYYAVGSSIHQAFSEVAARPVTGDVAAIGLGVGSVACHPRGPRTLTFFEINPAVTRLASNDQYFSFLTRCQDGVAVRHGDGRLKIAEADKGAYDLIFLDAFSSDSIPVHLLTREAVELYLDKLAPGGLLAVHITNRHLDLGPVLAAVAQDLNLAAIERVGRGASADAGNSLLDSRSRIVVLARNAKDFGSLSGRSGWTPLERIETVKTWTDGYSNILAVLKGMTPVSEVR